MRGSMSYRSAFYAVILLFSAVFGDFRINGYIKGGREFYPGYSITGKRAQIFLGNENIMAQIFGCGTRKSHMGISTQAKLLNFTVNYRLEIPKNKTTIIQGYAFDKIIHQEFGISYENEHFGIANHYKLLLMNSPEFEKTQTEGDDFLKLYGTIQTNKIEITPSLTYVAGLNEDEGQNYWTSNISIYAINHKNWVKIDFPFYFLSDITFGITKISAYGEMSLQDNKFIQGEVFTFASKNHYFDGAIRPGIYFGNSYLALGGEIISKGNKIWAYISARSRLNYKKLSANLVFRSNLKNKSRVESEIQFNITQHTALIFSYYNLNDIHRIFFGAKLF